MAKRRARRGRGLMFLIGLALLANFTLLRGWDPFPLETLRLRSFDLYQRIAPRTPEELPIAIVDIDEASLAATGQWPWPRVQVAALIEQIMAAGAAAVALDVIFSEPDRMSPALVAGALPGLDAETRAALEALPSNDAQLAATLSRHAVVVGQAGVRAGAGGGVQDGPHTSFAVIGPDPTRRVVQFPALLRNVPELEAAAIGRGLFSLKPEVDGVVRRLPAVTSVQGALAPSLSIDLLRVALGQSTIIVRANEEGVEGIVIGDLLVPTDRDGQLWVHFAEPDPTRYVSAQEVLSGRVDPGRLAGKLVFIGTSAVGLLDIRATPISGALPGVEVHAQLLETILTDAQLVRPDYALGAELVVTFIVGLLIIILTPRLGALWVLGLGGAVAVGLVAASWRLYVDERILLDVTYPLAATFAIFLAMSFYNYLREERERNWIRAAFGRYLAPNVVERLADEHEGLSLGGQTRELTVLFSDVRGFTGVAEAYRDDPQGLTELMNRFLTPMSNAITERDGTIDKYMGDAIMAFWNAPLDVAQHAAKACAAALDMLARIDALNAARRADAARGGAQAGDLNVGVGINTGACVVGNMGSELRFDYSALGDPVNLASRLEGLTRQYEVAVVVGETTAAACGGAFAFAPLDRIRVKGKTRPETVYALLGDERLAASEEFQALRQAVERMQSAYAAQEWDRAEAALSEARAADAESSLSGLFALYQSRIAGLRAAPPDPGWDGTETATTK